MVRVLLAGAREMRHPNMVVKQKDTVDQNWRCYVFFTELLFKEYAFLRTTRSARIMGQVLDKIPPLHHYAANCYVVLRALVR